MTASPKTGRGVLWLLPLVLAPAAFFASMQWLKSIDKTVLTLAGVTTAIFVMGYSLYLSIRSQRDLDEVQKASAGFSGRWGGLAGTLVFALLLNLPPFIDLVTGLIRDWAGDGGATVSRKVVALSMAIAFCGTVLLQTISTVVVQAFWWKAKQ